MEPLCKKQFRHDMTTPLLCCLNTQSRRSKQVGEICGSDEEKEVKELGEVRF